MVEARPPTPGTGRSLAGQIRHSCPSGISNGEASGLRLGRPLVTVTMMDFPGIAVWAALIDPRGTGPWRISGPRPSPIGAFGRIRPLNSMRRTRRAR